MMVMMKMMISLLLDSTENMDSKVEESTDGWIWDEESNEWIEDPNYNFDDLSQRLHHRNFLY